VHNKDDYPAAPQGPQQLKVQIRTSDERNAFTPENQPEKNVWFGRDAQAMGKQLGLDVLPFTFDVVGVQEKDVYPVPSQGEIKMRNDHLGYAITWFGVGLGALVITLLYHRRKPEDEA
jgi:surfeit locus 1 family protein